ncbi:MAG: methionyl-tRNA formyltransferase [Candidatus Aminicenantes bacterium]|nr:methionyl-tRNA formyltransferase [Candidatus Aminicenantes bacterium]
MKIVFFGSPPSALESFNGILEDGHKIELLITQPDRPSGRGHSLSLSPLKKRALEKDIPVLQPEKIRKNPDILKQLAEVQPDLNVVVAYGQIIPTSITNLPKYNSINLHFSLLPRYRGASPMQWSLLNGDRETGITIFELNEKMDEGDILNQKKIEILPLDDAFSLESRLAHAGAQLLSETIATITTILPRKQDHALATYAPKIKKEDGRIDWNQNALHIERMLKAFTPWPTVYTFFGNTRLKIIKGRHIELHSTEISPGQIINIDKNGIQAACRGGSLFLIETLQPENKKIMDAYAFSLGSRILPGMNFKGKKEEENF